MQNKKCRRVPSKKTTLAFLKSYVEIGTLQHIPNSRGNPWRFAISLGVKYLSLSVDNFISFSSSGNSSMHLNTDSSYEEYPKQQISPMQAKYVQFNTHILKEYFFITVPKIIACFAWKCDWWCIFAVSQHMDLQERSQCCHKGIRRVCLQVQAIPILSKIIKGL